MDAVTIALYIVVFLFGITVGSFLNVCICRLPGGESIVTVPSHCMNCGRRLRWYELIPLFSFLFLRGRCASCKSRISAQYPLIEAANGVLWLLVLRRLGPTAEAALGAMLLSALLVLSVIDLRTREIPAGLNWFILALGILRLLLDLQNWQLHVIGFFAVALPLYLLFLLSGGTAIGGGDVKLMAVCGLFLGWKTVLLGFFLGCALGAVIHLTLMAFKKAGHVLALGPYLSAGVAISLLWGDAAISWYLTLFV
ncbi:MAG: prepilin peptidase [Oscillospiraceae bacterium]|nr:prepilin peptidase [Oscillospiraceae bacterium]